MKEFVLMVLKMRLFHWKISRKLIVMIRNRILKSFHWDKCGIYTFRLKIKNRSIGAVWQRIERKSVVSPNIELLMTTTPFKRSLWMVRITDFMNKSTQRATTSFTDFVVESFYFAQKYFFMNASDKFIFNWNFY